MIFQNALTVRVRPHFHEYQTATKCGEVMGHMMNLCLHNSHNRRIPGSCRSHSCGAQWALSCLVGSAQAQMEQWERWFHMVVEADFFFTKDMTSKNQFGLMYHNRLEKTQPASGSRALCHGGCMRHQKSVLLF